MYFVSPIISEAMFSLHPEMHHVTECCLTLNLTVTSIDAICTIDSLYFSWQLFKRRNVELMGEEGGMFDSPLMDSYVSSTTAPVSSNLKCTVCFFPLYHLQGEVTLGLLLVVHYDPLIQ